MNMLRQVMRLPYMQGLWARFPIGSVDDKVTYGIYPYPHYAYGVYWSAQLAARLGIPRITVIEFGVAGGRGLVALEAACTEIGAALGVATDVVGFDAGSGMPPPADYRDLPHIWGQGFYKMDEAKLRAKLRTAQLILGDVTETVPAWLHTNPAPIGFIAFDLDYYSSTKAAFRIFEGDEATHLPRVHCFFDDLGCTDIGVMSRFVGEYLAIDEFNAVHADRKLCPIEQLRINRFRWESWQERMYAFHNFSHEQYTQHLLPSDNRHTQLPL
jgi:hypothetical protein